MILGEILQSVFCLVDMLNVVYLTARIEPSIEVKEQTVDGSGSKIAAPSFLSTHGSTQSSHSMQFDSDITKTCEGHLACKRFGVHSFCSDCGACHLWRLIFLRLTLDPGRIPGWHSNAFVPFNTTTAVSEGHV